MAACEKCWRDATMNTWGRPLDHSEEYHRLLAERNDNPCYAQDCPTQNPEHYSYAGCPECPHPPDDSEAA